MMENLVKKGDLTSKVATCPLEKLPLMMYKTTKAILNKDMGTGNMVFCPPKWYPSSDPIIAKVILSQMAKQCKATHGR